jgi:hypothetical protein
MDKLIKETINKTLKRLLQENQNNQVSFKGITTYFDDYFNQQLELIENKKEYLNTILDALTHINNFINNSGINISHVESTFKYNEFIFKYYIDGSAEWSDDEISEVEWNFVYNRNFEDYKELGIYFDIDNDSSSNGDFCFIIKFDVDNIKDFE